MKLDTTQYIKESSLWFILWPAMAVFISFKFYRESWSKNIVWFFSIFYGFTFIPVSTLDGSSYRDEFIAESVNEKTLDRFIGMFNPIEGGRIDFAKDLINFIVSGISTNYHFMFAVYGLIFGYFYSRNIWFLLDKVASKIKSDQLPLLVGFIVYIGIWEINGFRFWTATQLFLYGALMYAWSNKNRFVILAFCSIFIHIAFILPSIVLLIYWIFGNQIKIYFLLFLSSFIFAVQDISVVQNIALNYLPKIFHSKIIDYTNASQILKVTERLENKGLVYQIFLNLATLNLVIFAILIYLFLRSNYDKNKQLFTLLNISLLVFAISNYLRAIPSMGRFVNLSILFLLAFLFLYINFNKTGKIEKALAFLYCISVGWVLFIKSGQILFTTGIQTIVSNPFIAFLFESTTSLGIVVKDIFK